MTVGQVLSMFVRYQALIIVQSDKGRTFFSGAPAQLQQQLTDDVLHSSVTCFSATPGGAIAIEFKEEDRMAVRTTSNLTEEEKQRAIELFKEGKSISEVAKIMVRGSSTIAGVLRKANVASDAMRRPKILLSDEEYVTINKMLAKHITESKIAEAYGLASGKSLKYAMRYYEMIHKQPDAITENCEQTQIPEVEQPAEIPQEVPEIPAEPTPAGTNDPVNHPSHYTYAGMECIDMMQALYGREAVIAYCKCAAFKYVYRKGHKGTDEDAARDMEKAAWYARKAEELENGSSGI